MFLDNINHGPYARNLINSAHIMIVRVKLEWGG